MTCFSSSSLCCVWNLTYRWYPTLFVFPFFYYVGHKKELNIPFVGAWTWLEVTTPSEVRKRKAYSSVKLKRTRLLSLWRSGNVTSLIFWEEAIVQAECSDKSCLLLRAFFTAGAALSTSAALPCLNLRTDLLGSLHWLGSGRDIKWHVQLYILNKRRGQGLNFRPPEMSVRTMPQCRYLSCASKDGPWESADEGFGRKATHYWSLSTYHSGNAMQRKTRSLPHQVVDNCTRLLHNLLSLNENIACVKQLVNNGRSSETFSA